MPSSQTLRVGVCPNTSPYVHSLNGRPLFVGSGNARREFHLLTVPLTDYLDYRTALRAQHCHFLVEVEATPWRRVNASISRITFVSNGPGRTWKLYQGRGGFLGIRNARATLSSRQLPRPRDVVHQIQELLEAMGRDGQDRWLAAVRRARSKSR